jgi:hypothetical protein
MKNASITKEQTAYCTARYAFDAADKGYHDELAVTGIQGKIDAWEDGDLDPAVQSAHDAIFAKWNVSALGKALDVAESNLVQAFLAAFEKRSPERRSTVATLRGYCASKTRFDPKRQEVVALALRWVF